MKHTKWLLGLGVLLIGVGGLYAWIYQPTVLPVPQTDGQPIAEVSPQTQGIAFLMERAVQPVPGVFVFPKTTAELRQLFESATQTRVPRVFVEKLPADFADQGDRTLFARVVSAWILRENEQTLKERAILYLLRQKMQQGDTWTQPETDFFDSLVVKYDSGAKRSRMAQLNDLMDKVDMVPPMVAVAQAALRTNFGKEHLDSPFDLYAWKDARHYEPVLYKTWGEAVDAYVREMNGMPPLGDWRVSRAGLRAKGYRDTGERVLKWLGNYKPEDPRYTAKLEQMMFELGDTIPDDLSFVKPEQTVFETGSTVIQTQKGPVSFQVEYAITPEEKEQGLMFRTHIPDKTGMVFLNENPAPMALWMKNTFIPLDLLFFDEKGNITDISENTQPMTLISHASRGAVAGAMEVPAGTVQKYGIHIGDKLHLTITE